MQYADQKHWFNFLAFLRKCLDPGVPKNGFRVGEDFSYKETVEYFCNPGFKLTEGTRFRSCQKNNKWNGTLPTCKGLLNHSEQYANHCDMNKFFHNRDNNYDNDNIILMWWQNNIFKSNKLHKIRMTTITFQLTSSHTQCPGDFKFSKGLAERVDCIPEEPSDVLSDPPLFLLLIEALLPTIGFLYKTYSDQ